jgi:hypothetical protein
MRCGVQRARGKFPEVSRREARDFRPSMDSMQRDVPSPTERHSCTTPCTAFHAPREMLQRRRRPAGVRIQATGAISTRSNHSTARLHFEVSLYLNPAGAELAVQTDTVYVASHLHRGVATVQLNALTDEYGNTRRTCIHTYMQACMHTYIHTYIHTYVRTYIHTYMHACMYVCVCVYVCICVYICIYMYTCIYVYM